MNNNGLKLILASAGVCLASCLMAKPASAGEKPIFVVIPVQPWKCPVAFTEGGIGYADCEKNAKPGYTIKEDQVDLISSVKDGNTTHSVVAREITFEHRENGVVVGGQTHKHETSSSYTKGFIIDSNVNIDKHDKLSWGR